MAIAIALPSNPGLAISKSQLATAALSLAIVRCVELEDEDLSRRSSKQHSFVCKRIPEQFGDKN
jgi:hypothetical protein